MSCAAAYNRTVLSKLSWMGRQLRRCEDLQSINVWANSMHLVKNLLITPATKKRHEPHVSNVSQVIPGQSSFSQSTAPCYYSKYPPGFLPKDDFVVHQKTQNDQHILKTGLHTTSVSKKNLHNERLKTSNTLHIGTPMRSSQPFKRKLSLTIANIPVITCAPKWSAIIDKSPNVNVSYLPKITSCQSISPSINLSIPPAAKARGAIKPVPKIKQKTILPDFAAKWSKLYDDIKEPSPHSQSSPLTRNSNMSTSSLVACRMQTNPGAALKQPSPTSSKEKLKCSKITLHEFQDDQDQKSITWFKDVQSESICTQSNIDKAKVGWADFMTWKNKYRRH